MIRTAAVGPHLGVAIATEGNRAGQSRTGRARETRADYGRLTTMPSCEDDAHRSILDVSYYPTRSIGLSSAEDRITDRYHFSQPSQCPAGARSNPIACPYRGGTAAGAGKLAWTGVDEPGVAGERVAADPSGSARYLRRYVGDLRSPAPLGHIMPDHEGDRSAVFMVLAPHDHLHIKHERTLIGPQVWRLVTRGDSRARQPLLRSLNRRNRGRIRLPVSLTPVFVAERPPVVGLPTPTGGTEAPPL